MPHLVSISAATLPTPPIPCKTSKLNSLKHEVFMADFMHQNPQVHKWTARDINNEAAPLHA